MDKPAFGEVCLCAIITVVVGIFIAPVFASSHRGPGRQQGLSNLKQSSLAVLMYSGDYDDQFPFVTAPAQLVEVTFEYSKNRDIWQTLNTGKPGIFVYNSSLPGASLMDVESPAETPMLLDPYARRATEQSSDWTYLTSFVDGHARVFNQKSWPPVQAKLPLKLKRHGKPIGLRK